ncbi:hypothetical protein B566_EDAN016989 [Ephemera danica]|nr:hypothetical protein B566_EDAN016989 [Ephemera danica]
MDLKECNFCKMQLYGPVLDLHVSLSHLPISKSTTKRRAFLTCPTCQRMLCPEAMTQHILVQHPPKPNLDLKSQIFCHYCHRKYSYCVMAEHLETHGPNTWTRCLHCNKMVKNTKVDEEIHLINEHSGGEVLACRTCDRRYSTTGRIQAHMQTILINKYECPLQSCYEICDTFTLFRQHVLLFHPTFEYDMQAEIKKETDAILQSITAVTKPEFIEIEAPPVTQTSSKEKHLAAFHMPKLKCQQCGELIPRFKMTKHLKLHEIDKEANCIEVKTEPFEEIFTSEFAIEENAIKLESGEDPLDCLSQYSEVKE